MGLGAIGLQFQGLPVTADRFVELPQVIADAIPRLLYASTKQGL